MEPEISLPCSQKLATKLVPIQSHRHNPCKIYCNPNVITEIKSRRKRQAGHVACIWKIRNAYLKEQTSWKTYVDVRITLE
jgi:hypothetical protein